MEKNNFPQEPLKPESKPQDFFIPQQPAQNPTPTDGTPNQELPQYPIHRGDIKSTPAIAIPRLNLNKQFFMKLGIGALVLSILGGGAWFAYSWYQRSSDEKILNAAAKNLLNTRGLHSAITVGAYGFQVKGDIYIDNDQDAKLTINTDFVNAEGINILKDDKAYAGYSEEDDQKEYYEFTNIKKTLEKYENEFAMTDVLNPAKNFFSGENMKYVKRVGTDVIDGQKLHKFEFSPTEQFVKDKLNKATQGKELSFVLEKSSIKISFWIRDADLKLGKIDGTLGIKIGESDSAKAEREKEKNDCIEENSSSKYKSSSSCSYYDRDPYQEEFNFTWNQNFSYDFKEDIKAPEEKQILETMNLLYTIDGTYDRDQSKVSDMQTIQGELKDFREEKGYYPYKLDQLNIPSYYDIELSKYEYKPSGNNVQSYTLSVKLEVPEAYSDSHIKDGIFTLTEKDNAYYELKKTEKASNSLSAIKARDARRKSDLRMLETAIESYYADNDKYPSNLSDLSNYVSERSGMPTDPVSGGNYSYAVSQTKEVYELNAKLENTDDTSDNEDGGNNPDLYEVGSDPGLDLI